MPVGLAFQVSIRGEVGYVLPSMHGGSPVEIVLTDRVKRFLAWADVVAFEAVPDRPAGPPIRQNIMARTKDGPMLTEVIPSDLAARIRRELDRRGASDEDWDRLLNTKVEFAAWVLDAIAARAGRDTQTAQRWSHPGIDMLVLAEARQGGRPVEELEGAVRQLRNRFTLSDDEAVAELEDIVARLERDLEIAPKAGDAERHVRLLFSGELEPMYASFRATRCASSFLRNVCDKTIDGRNPYLASRIDALISSGRKVVAVVGALHAAGPNSVLDELRKRGYTIRPML